MRTRCQILTYLLLPLIILVFITLSLIIAFQRRTQQHAAFRYLIPSQHDRASPAIQYATSSLNTTAASASIDPAVTASGLASITPFNATSTTTFNGASNELPITILSYSRAPGSKHCRGHVIHNLSIPRPAAQWQAGTCVTLPREAECGIFFAGKGDACEAELYITEDCAVNSYVNTAAFTPDMQPVAGAWRSMWVRCGIEVPVVTELDPAALGITIKKKPNT